MKQDIEELKRLFYTDRLTQYGKRKLIEYYEKQIKELEEEKEVLVETVSQLTKENSELKDIIREHTLLISPYYVAQNYIPVSLVEETIEELNEYYKKEIYPSLINWSDVDITECYDVMIEILQELLEKR